MILPLCHRVDSGKNLQDIYIFLLKHKQWMNIKYSNLIEMFHFRGFEPLKLLLGYLFVISLTLSILNTVLPFFMLSLNLSRVNINLTTGFRDDRMNSFSWSVDLNMFDSVFLRIKSQFHFITFSKPQFIFPGLLSIQYYKILGQLTILFCYYRQSPA